MNLRLSYSSESKVIGDQYGTANRSLKLMAVYMLAVLLVLGGSAFGQESGLPVRYNATTLQGDGQVCPPTDQRDAARANISEDIRSLITTSVLPVIQSCDCGGPGWTRIAYLDTTDPTQQCPPNWGPSVQGTCKRRVAYGCDSAIFSNNGGVQYSQVCGRIKGYQVGTPNAFKGNDIIDSVYVEGVSLTHGSPREHIWTFAAARDETTNDCPCTNINNPPTNFYTPSFVGDDYFCETGVPPGSSAQRIFYLDDPLWDGDGCGPTSTCCTFNNPPWFCKQLPQPTTDDLEARICGQNDDMHTIIEQIEIYVK